MTESTDNTETLQLQAWTYGLMNFTNSLIMLEKQAKGDSDVWNSTRDAYILESGLDPEDFKHITINGTPANATSEVSNSPDNVVELFH